MKLSEVIKDLAERIAENGDMDLPDDFIISYKYGCLTID